VVDIIQDETEYLIKSISPRSRRKRSRLPWETAYSFFLASVSLKRRKKAENITVLSGPMAALGDNADAEKVNAEFNDGVLKLHIAKREAALPKQIE
jgi:hypothetical protein